MRKIKLKWVRKNNIYSINLIDSKDIIESENIIEKYKFLIKEYKSVYDILFYEPFKWNDTEIYQAIFVSKQHIENFNEVKFKINDYSITARIKEINITPIPEVSTRLIPVFEIEDIN